MFSLMADRNARINGQLRRQDETAGLKPPAPYVTAKNLARFYKYLYSFSGHIKKRLYGR